MANLKTKILKALHFLYRFIIEKWLVLLLVAITESVFWPSIMQLDHMSWNCYWASDKVGEMWIPELGLTYYQCFILFFGLAIIAFHLAIATIVWMAAQDFYLHSYDKKD